MTKKIVHTLALAKIATANISNDFILGKVVSESYFNLF